MSIARESSSRNSSTERAIPTVYDPRDPSKVIHPKLGLISAALAGQIYEQKIESQRNAELSVAASVAYLQSNAPAISREGALGLTRETQGKDYPSNVSAGYYDRTRGGGDSVYRSESILSNDSTVPFARGSEGEKHRGDKSWISRLGFTKK